MTIAEKTRTRWLFLVFPEAAVKLLTASPAMFINRTGNTCHRNINNNTRVARAAGGRSRLLTAAQYFQGMIQKNTEKKQGRKEMQNLCIAGVISKRKLDSSHRAMACCFARSSRGDSSREKCKRRTDICLSDLVKNVSTFVVVDRGNNGRRTKNSDTIVRRRTRLSN